MAREREERSIRSSSLSQFHLFFRGCKQQPAVFAFSYLLFSVVHGAIMTTTNEQVEVKLLKDNKNMKTYNNDLETITLDNTNDAENNNSDAQHKKM